MPKIFEWNGYKFFFFSNEGIPREPCHVHIRKGEKSAKFWINPYVSLVYSHDMTSKELLGLEKLIHENIDGFRRKWDEHFSD